ncbi:DinB family protein [Tenacibaculum discolor]|uniref:DinB family protein n=1 Tax=Tenacibaculum discolor TaxID=361581 RepID=UPI001F498F80|nr:DinB family protein [Tenacibaculum discolor]
MYMKLVKKDGSLIEQLKSSLHKTKSLINNLSNDELDYRYEKNKWSIKEVLVHIIDDERIYGYRALSFARNDKTNLPGFEQEDYNYYSDTSERTIENILEEYEALRLSTIALFNGLSDKSLKHIGIANGNRASARALGYHILGHELHHIKTIENLYLKALKK